LVAFSVYNTPQGINIMTQYFETSVVPDVAAGAVAQHLRVKTPGAVAVAGALEDSFGTMDTPCLAAGTCAVRLKTAVGTRKMVAAGAITRGAYVYGAASGKVSAVANGNIEGIVVSGSSKVVDQELAAQAAEVF
jgi:hypothetical protein